jgi:hypothetical protein
MTAREMATRDYWAKSQAVLYRHDEFARQALILLAEFYKPSIAPLSDAATRTLLAHAMRNPK